MQKMLDRLKALDPKARQLEIETLLKTEKRPREVDKLVKELKILRNINELKISPIDAFTREYVPVIPSMYRAPIEMPGGSLYNPDINVLTRNIGLVNNVVNEAKGKVDAATYESLKKDLYGQLEQLVAVDAPEDPKKELKRNYFTTIAGTKRPKSGHFQSKMIRKRQDLSARGVIIPNPELGMDEAEIPFNIGFKIYEPFLRRELNDRGYKKDEIDAAIKNQTPLAKKTLQRIGDERPVVLNRAPSIWGGSVTGHKPIFVDKESVGIPNLLSPYQKADYDGDSVLCDIHLRVSHNNNMPPITRFLLTVFNSTISCLYNLFKGDKYVLRNHRERTGSDA